MAVPSGNSHLKNTAGGAYTQQSQGGTILGNQTEGSAVTNALSLIDNTVSWDKGALPRVLNNGLSSNQKAFASGTFAYASTGEYLVRTIADSLSGVASDSLLVPASEVAGRRPIHKFRHDFGAAVASKYRAGEYTLTGTKSDGTVSRSRLIWLDAAGTNPEAPTQIDNFMYDIADGDSLDLAADSAAEPTRDVPGELVLKVDFVDLSVATGGDFFNYKPITG